MGGLKNYREKIKNIEKLVNKMESGELSIHELVELETLTRQLHERSIILKYKAFEEVGAQREKTGQDLDPEDDFTEEVAEIVEDVLDETEEQESPTLDFSIFDEPEEPKKTTPKHQVTLTQSDKIEEKIEKEEPKEEKKSASVAEVPAEVKPEAKQEVKPEPRPEVKPEVKSKPIAEDPIVVVKQKGSSFLDRLSIADNSIGSQIAGRKIETLSGAFGINERLLYINELFDGSGEDFSNAIKTLDTQKDLDSASVKVEELAFKNSWNPEEEVVLEFLAIIKRRYA